MTTFRRLFEILGALLTYGVLPELKLTRRRRVSRPIRLRLAFEELGPTWIKLGQALALRYDLLPQVYCDELSNLFNAVAPFPYTEVESIIRGDFGLDVSDVYPSFDPEPFAAASIGQVHRARLPSGEQVAVKVQRPGIRDQVETDLRLMYRLAFLPDIMRVLGGTPTRDVIDEFARWLSDELDYRTEAMNAYTIRENARFDPIEYNPRVWLDYCTERVLTQEYVDGTPVSDILKDLRRDPGVCVASLREQGCDLDRIATNIVWNFFNQVYAIGQFHADLQPANLIVLPGSRIAYVDFGLIGRLPANVRDSLGLFARRLLRGDVDGALSELTKWVTPSAGTDQQGALDQLARLAQSYLFELRATARSRQALDATYQIALLGAIRRHRMTVAPVVLSYIKTMIAIDTITCELSPTLDLAKLERRFFTALTMDQVRTSLTPATVVDAVMEYRARIDYVLDFVDTVIVQQRTAVKLLGSARRWIERLALGGVVILFAGWMAERFTGHTRGAFGTNAGFLLLAASIVFIASLLRQTRKLPASGTGGAGRRRLKHGETVRERHGSTRRPVSATRLNPQASRSGTRAASGRRR